MVVERRRIASLPPHGGGRVSVFAGEEGIGRAEKAATEAPVEPCWRMVVGACGSRRRHHHNHHLLLLHEAPLLTLPGQEAH